MTKWGVTIVVVAFILTIFLDWGANFGSRRTASYAITIDGDGLFAADDEISYDEINRRVNARESANLTDTDRRKNYRDVVDEIIAERLAIREANKRGLVATELEIVSRLFSNDQGNVDWGRYEEAKRGRQGRELAFYEKSISEDIALFKIFNAVTAGITIPPGELDDFHHLRFQRATLRHILIRPGDFVPIERAKSYYDANPDSFLIPERAKARHILFGFGTQSPSNAQKIEARGRAEVALLRLGRGESFDALYEAMKSDTSGQVLAEELDWFGRGQMVPEFDSVAFTHPVGVPTQIIETMFGYHIAIFDAREKEHLDPFSDVSDGIRASLSGESEIQSAKARAEEIKKKLDAGESFEALARAFSSGKSAADGGLLGEVIPGEMTSEIYPDTKALERIGREAGRLANEKIILDPAITQQLFDLEIGKISDVVASGHGYHIVRIEGRRGGDAALRTKMDETLRAEYLNALRRQVFAEWTKELREKADIELSKEVENRL